MRVQKSGHPRERVAEGKREQCKHAQPKPLLFAFIYNNRQNRQSNENKREYFTPSEGAYRHQLVSTKLQNNGSSYFISDIEHKATVKATYSISKKLFILKDKKYRTADYPEAPWKKGLYDIEIPDFPHGRNDLYAEAKRQKVWFRIGHGGERYLHVGRRSLGCITVIETTRWMEIYNILIMARKGDFMSVGILEVID